MVDGTDYERISAWRWSCNSNGYAFRTVWRDGTVGAILLHREILGLRYGDGLEVDHINGDKLDNRRENLRVVTRAQQTQNVRRRKATTTSRFRGVYLERRAGRQPRWVVRPRINGVCHYVGRFVDEVEAAKAAEAWRQEHLPFAEPDPALAAVLRS